MEQDTVQAKPGGRRRGRGHSRRSNARRLARRRRPPKMMAMGRQSQPRCDVRQLRRRRPRTARELGDLFEYRIAAPVTVRKGESAMLPFLQQKIEARKLLIYSDQSLAATR